MVGRIKVRVDDFPNTKGEPQHTLKAYREFHERLGDLIGGARYLLGVIPGRCDDGHFQFLREHPEIVVGMHGINHDEKKLDLYKDEFGGPGFPPTSASSNAILKKLRDARTKLEDNCGSRVRIYMPPRNYIGHQTIAVLAQAGFDSFTCGPGTPDGTPDNWLVPSFGEVHSIWSYFPYGYGRTDEMLERSAHEYLIAQCLSGYDTVLCIHHTWETNIGFDHMDAFFSKIGNEFFKDFI